METTGQRMTRSRAKALGTTPMTAAPPAKTPEPKTTGRRRKGAAQSEQSAPVEKQLFHEDAPSADDQQVAMDDTNETDLTQERSLDQVATNKAEDAFTEEVDVDLHTDSHVLMASPILQPAPAEAEAFAPLPLNLASQETEATVLLSPAPAAAPTPMGTPQPSPGAAFPLAPYAQHSPMLTPSPLPAGQATPLPIAASPLVFDLASPAPMAAPTPVMGSPLPAATPLSFTSDAPYRSTGAATGQPGPSPIAGSMPATPLSFSSMADAVDAAEFSPMPEDDQLDGSPISLAGTPGLTPLPAQQLDADMGDATPLGHNLPQPAMDANPMTFASDRAATPLPEPSPMAGFLGAAPGSVPHSAAPVGTVPRASDAAAGFLGFTPIPPHLRSAEAQVESPSLDGLSTAAVPAGGPSPSPFSLTPPMPPLGQLQDVNFSPLPAISPLNSDSVPPVPAPTPEGCPLPGYTLAQTPLAGAIASAQPAADEEAYASGDYDEMCAEDDDMQSAGGDMMEEQEIEQVEAVPIAATPVAAAKTPSGVRSTPAAARTPVVGSAAPLRNLTPKSVKATPSAKASTPAAASPYVHVESRYNKPRTPAASTPVAPVAAATTKSIKRVSIHTPEGPRSTVPQRQVVPTPYRPKSASGASSPAGVMEEQPQAEVSAAAEERRVKAAERLKSIHASEQAVPSAGPSYLAPTQAFAGKSAKSIKSKVDAADYDPRSLRQIKREIKDLVAKKAEKKSAAAVPVSLSEPRDSKLTPKVQERELPMPDDGEDSDHEAEYNEAVENELAEAMGGLEVAPESGATMPLRGLPAPKGRHLRFGEKGQVTESPQRTVLRGLPVAVGKYKRFD